MLLMEFMAGRDLRTVLNANTCTPDGSRLFGWYNRYAYARFSTIL